jgi:hypothetical protein
MLSDGCDSIGRKPRCCLAHHDAGRRAAGLAYLPQPSQRTAGNSVCRQPVAGGWVFVVSKLPADASIGPVSMGLLLAPAWQWRG